MSRLAWLSSWRLPLRLARRDAARARGRSILVLVMIALPVLAVTAADVVLHTQSASGVETLDRRLGVAAALVTSQDGQSEVVQGFDPDDSGTIQVGESLDAPATTLAQVQRVLGPDRPVVEQRSGDLRVATGKGVGHAEGNELDLGDPLTAGLVDLTAGRLPASAGEVVINRALADKGYAVGDRLDVEDAATDPTVVGIAESTRVRDYPMAFGPLDSLGVGADGMHSWLVGGRAVTWDQVQALNAIGAVGLSRAVVTDPPPSTALDPRMTSELPTEDYSATIAVVVLIVVMALIEVVLLAGPAFAVGARKLQRSLALMAATGGTPAQGRRVVMAGALVLGGLASAGGVVLGIGVGRLAVPVAQQHSVEWFGPFEVPWLQLVGIAGFGLLSAVLAAVVPAWIASRQDVVAVLAGRRGDRRPSVRSPILGLVLLGLGVAGAAYGATSADLGAYLIAGSAIVAVLGMILLVPVVLALLSRLSRALPLTLRYAVRDAARHRTRTVPAVAAVAATVAGVVALGIATSSDEAQNEASYLASVAPGLGVVQLYNGEAPAPYRAVLEREVPDGTITEIRGIEDFQDDRYSEVDVTAGQQPMLDSSGSALGAGVLVSDGQLPPGLLGVPDDQRAAAARMLARGGVVAFTTLGAEADRVRIKVTTYDDEGGIVGTPASGRFPALVVPLDYSYAGPTAVVSTPVAEALGRTPAVVGLAVSGTDISRQQETDVDESISSFSDGVEMYVERGYQPDSAAVITQWVLFALGAVLMLGGTLTATFLALSDAKPDLATLSAVGASPRMRRGVAAAYAVVVGFVGALLGAAVGFIPGIAITYPLTGGSWTPTGVDDVASHYLAIPWPLILGLVVALPLLTALIVGLSARSRLPLVARLE